VSLSACNFLDVEPQIIDGEGYYTNEDKVLYGLAGVYGALSSDAVYGDYYSLQISNADDLCYYNNYNNSDARVDKYNHNAGTAVVYETWSKLYEGIKNANVFMEELARTEIEADKLSNPLDLYIAEARFMRPITTSCWRRRGAMCLSMSVLQPRPTRVMCRFLLPLRRRF
jgi:hypothetical protein